MSEIDQAPATAPLDRPAEALRVARELFESRPTWVSFFRETLSRHGICHELFPGCDELRSFRRTPQYREIVAMLDALYEGRPLARDRQPQRMITVRLPAELHDSLRRRAAARRISLNRFCVVTLLEAVTAPESG